MNVGRVLGSVWSTKRMKELPPGAFLEVELDGGAGHVVAFDVLGSGIGERVLVTRGAAALAWFGETKPPIDALIIGSVDEPHTND